MGACHGICSFSECIRLLSYRHSLVLKFNLETYLWSQERRLELCSPRPRERPDAGASKSGPALHVRNESFATDVFSASAERCPLSTESDRQVVDERGQRTPSLYWGSHHLRQIRTSRGALVAHVASLLLRTVGGDLGKLIQHLGITPALLDQLNHLIWCV